MVFQNFFGFVWPFGLVPGANCNIVGCSTSRRSGISIFKLPSGEDNLSKKTREEWVNQITGNQVIDADLRCQINEGKLQVCKKHFEEKFIEKHKYFHYCKICMNCNDICIFMCQQCDSVLFSQYDYLFYTVMLFVLITDATCKRLLPEAIPTLNLPQKSCDTETKPRKPLKCHETDEGLQAATPSTSNESSRVYKHLDDFKRTVAAVKLTGWLRKEHEQKFIFEYFGGRQALPIYSLIADSALGFSVTVFGWFLPDDHEIYLEQKRSLFHVTISALRNCAIICCLFRFGSTVYKCLNPYNSTTTYHSVPLRTDVYDENGPPFQVDLFFRSNDSFVLCNENKCNTCLNYINKEVKKKCVPAKQSLPIKDKAPLTACSKR